ncbi:MAG: iron-containing alcohol dehydrogenase [Verrucomicrobiae bacterium]|nr:iron-containing alcohol dehydrogenase [Verrucomicrobiae bacterium]
MNISNFKVAHKLVTGSGSVTKLREEALRLGIRNPLIVTDKILQSVGTVRIVEEQLAGMEFGVYNGVKPEPEIYLVDDCRKQFAAGGHDGLIAVGGGSAMDIAKAVSAVANHQGEIADLFGVDLVKQKGPPVIAIPTTAGTGSEVTNIAILSDKQAQLKKGIVSDFILPDVAIVSPEMTVTMPKSVTAASGIDALVHAVEAYISVHASPITDALALGAIKMISANLPVAYDEPNNLAAREAMVTGSLMAGMAFGNAGVGAVHALAYPLGGRYNIAHGVSNALLLPYVMHWNKESCLKKFRDIAQAMDIDTRDLTDREAAAQAVEKMDALCRQVEIPRGLSSLNIPRSALPEMATDAIQIDRLLKNNPRVLSEEDVLKIYESAY